MAHRGETKASTRRIEAAERQAKALELRKAGHTFEEIAQFLGYKGFEGAYKAVKAGLKRVCREPAEEVRTLELARLDKLLTVLWPKAITGDPESIDRVLKVMHRRASLLGLDAVRPTAAERSLIDVNELYNYISLFLGVAERIVKDQEVVARLKQETLRLLPYDDSTTVSHQTNGQAAPEAENAAGAGCVPAGT
jgi:hypothetical protein